MIQIAFTPDRQKWEVPVYRDYDLDPLQCSDRLKVTESLIIQACESTKTITISRRSNLSVLYQKQYSENRFYFKQLFSLVQKQGAQTYIFYSMSSNLAHRIGMIEVLIDEAKGDEDQLVLDRGELSVPSNDDAPISNDGPI